MRGFAIVGLLLALAARSVAAQDVAPGRMPAGYAFDNPRLLTHQLIWGRLHGARLLGLACHDRGDVAAALAYVDWLDRQWPRIRAAGRDLARHYYRQEQMPLEALDAALNLKVSLDLPGDELVGACATLPEALASPRNDLAHFYTERRRAIERGDADFPGAVWQETE